MIAAIIQARMSSTRLPGKTLADIAGEPVLAHVVRRAGRIPGIERVVIATTHNPADDAIVRFANDRGIAVHRGSEDDVLSRFYETAQRFGISTIVRVTPDCPLLDPQVSGQVLGLFLRAQGALDYVSNSHPLTFPDGLDTEVFSFAALEKAWREARLKSEREHVTPFICKQPAVFRLANVKNDEDLSAQRWTVDEPQDLEFVRSIYKHLGGQPEFGMRDVLALLQRQPELLQLQGKAIMNEGYYKSLYQQAAAGAAPKRAVVQSQAWLARSQKVIPGCSQTFSKSCLQYVQGVSPIFLQRGKGCRVWDVDGNEFIDYIQGLLPNILGYAHDEVNAAAAAQLAQGHSFSLPHPLEVQLAERLTRLIPCAEMVRFGKNGSDATTGAVRAARAFTGRDRIACCGYHGWQDWYIGSTTRNKGVPGAVCALTHTFPYNNPAALEKLLNEHPGEFAAVIMEPVNYVEPAPDYLQGVKDLARRHGALLIFDEICTGFHLGLGGAQKRLGVTPDLACFGKAMGNGFPIAAIVGRADVMKTFEDIFCSFTFGGETASMAAAMKVLDILEQTDALARMAANGRRLQDGFNALAKLAGLFPRFQCIGYPVWSLLKFRDAEGKDSLLERSLFQQEVVKRGILQLVTHNMTAAHDDASTERTLEIYAAVLKTLAGWLADREPARFLEGPMIQPVFRVR